MVAVTVQSPTQLRMDARRTTAIANSTPENSNDDTSADHLGLELQSLVFPMIQNSIKQQSPVTPGTVVKRLRRRKTPTVVTFNSLVHIHPIPSRRDLQPHLSRLYVTRQDMKASQQDIYQTLRSISLNTEDEDMSSSHESLLLRGLEAFLPRNVPRLHNMKTAVRLILECSSPDSITEEWLERHYRPLARAATQAALDQGRCDQGAVPETAPPPNMMLR
jgi:hypothetical protein